MIRHLTITLLACALAACNASQPAAADPAKTQTQAQAQAQTTAPVADAAAFEALPAPAETFASPLAIADNFAQYRPEAEGEATLDLTSRRSDRAGALELIVTAAGYADDSLKGERWRVLVEPSGDGWRVIEAGRQVSCYRGAAAGSWTRGPCP